MFARHGHVRVQRVVLEHHRDVAMARREPGHVAPADPHRPGGQRLEPATIRSVVLFPQPDGPDEHDELARRHLEADVVDRDDPAGELLAHALEDDARVRRSH